MDEVEKHIEQLKDPDWRVRNKAAWALVETENALAVPVLIEALKDEHEEVRWVAAAGLHGFGGTKAIEPLIEALKDKYELVRKIAIAALAKIGEPAVPGLINALKEMDLGEDAEENTISVLRYIGKPAVHALIEYLKGEKAEVQGMCFWALGEMGDPEAVPVLIEALEDEDPDARRDLAVDALGKIGDVRAVEPLIERLGDKDVQWDIPEALGDIGDARALQPLTEWLRSYDMHMRIRSLRALVKLAPVGEVNLSEVRASLKEFVALGGSRELKERRKKLSLELYLEMANSVAKKKGMGMAGNMLPARIKPPKKPRMYRKMRRALA